MLHWLWNALIQQLTFCFVRGDSTFVMKDWDFHADVPATSLTLTKILKTKRKAK